MMKSTDMTWRYTCWLIMLMTLSHLGWGQPDCDCETIRSEASALHEVRNQKVERYQRAKQTYDSLIEVVNRRKGINLPKYRKSSFDESPDKFHDDAACWEQCQDTWNSSKKAGDYDWGYKLDIRQVNIEKHQHYLEDIEDKQRQLLKNYPFLQASAPVVSAPAARPLPPESSSVAGQSITQAARRVFQDKTYVYCRVDPRRGEWHIEHRRGATAPHGFDLIKENAEYERKRLVFAVNAGMFHPDKRPVGLLVSDGREWGGLNRQTNGRGNFFLNPNGVFWLDQQGQAHIEPTPIYDNLSLASQTLRIATQSGPMLLRDGGINQLFTPNSPNRYFRNAVGVTASGQVVFVISEQRVCFYELALFMREELGCQDALYLDGAISRMYLPTLGKTRLDDSQHLGPILYILE